MAPNENEFVSIRLSDLLRDCSVGAIVRHARTLMVVQDTRHWDGPNTHPHEREIRYVDLVKRSLNLEGTKLCRPPVRQKVGGLIQGWVPARRFPEWTRCNRCGLLRNAPWRRRGGDENDDSREHPTVTIRLRENHRCTGPESHGKSQDSGAEAGPCGGTLEQVPWVLVHENGYLADVPWHALAHDGVADATQSACKPEWKTAYLRIENRAGQLIVACGRCDAHHRLRIPTRFGYGASTRQQPWVREPSPEPMETPGWLVGVNDVRVHFAECRSALVIPPESRIRRGTVVDRLYSSSADQALIRTALNRFARRSRCQSLATKYRSTPEAVEEAFEKIESGELAMELPSGELAQLEYAALTQPIPDLRPDEDFVTEHHRQAWRRLGRAPKGTPAGVAAAVENVVAVHRLKEIMVFEGFRRGRVGDAAAGKPTPPHIVGENDWLPALELWGEGLFFTFKEKEMARWEAQPSARTRAEATAKRAEAVHLPKQVNEILPRFLLCHTLAHLVIRRLEAEAGYPAASLRERIYCASPTDGDEGMAGVLIYVAVADTHGSLGGLMDMAQPDRFLRLLTGAVEGASWCSFDPVCREQEGHGPDLLNRAACHACALVPEPSCICGNRLLDRAFVAGDGQDMRSLWDLAVHSPGQ